MKEEDKYGEYEIMIIDKEYVFLKGNWAVVSVSLFGSLTRKMGVLNKLTSMGYIYKFKSLGGIYFIKENSYGE